MADVERVTSALLAYEETDSALNCDGASAYDNPGGGWVRLFQEWQPDSTGGWCRKFQSGGTNQFNFPNPHVDQLDSMCVGWDMRLEVFHEYHAGGDRFWLEGSDDYGYNCFDFAQGWPWPAYYWHDQARSFRSCKRANKVLVNGVWQCPAP